MREKLLEELKMENGGKVEQAFAGLSIDEAGAVLERVGPGFEC